MLNSKGLRHTIKFTKSLCQLLPLEATECDLTPPSSAVSLVKQGWLYACTTGIVASLSVEVSDHEIPSRDITVFVAQAKPSMYTM